MQRLVCSMAVVTAVGALMPMPAQAQPASGDAAINNAISEAVREGSSQFTPPRAGP